MINKELQDIRKQMIDKMEQKLAKIQKPEDDIFYYHSCEDRIVLSHALFWVMTQNIKGNIAKEKYFLLLRQYQEEMLEAYLTEDDSFPDLLHYCNVIYNALPIIISETASSHTDKSAPKLAAMAIVAGGYGGDMPTNKCDELLDDMDFCNDKVKCSKIERMLPKLNKMVETEQRLLGF